MAEAVDHRGQDTELGGQTRDDNGINTQYPEGLVEVGLEEGAEAPFGQNNIRGLGIEIRDNLCSFRPPNGMGFHLPIEDKIAFQKTVIGKDDGKASRSALL